MFFRDSQRKKILKFALLQSIPVLLGYVFLGIAFGLMLQRAGYSVGWAFFISVFVYAGSMQFVLIGLLTGGSSLIVAFIMTLSINSRHIFYGLSFVERFKKMGKYYPYMVFSLTDETYSLLCSTHVPETMNKDKVFFSISLLDQSYWVIGSLIGAMAGEWITIDLTGIDFAMTALFVVIFIEQWLSYKNHLSAIIGLGCGGISLVLFGPNGFILPSLSMAVLLLLLAQSKTSSQSEKENVLKGFNSENNENLQCLSGGIGTDGEA